VRLAGADRFATAAEISRHAYPGGADTVVVATGEAFADALSAGPAAARLGGPVLLTAGNRLPAATRDEILRLEPSQVWVVGGDAVISQAVFDEITALAPATRIAGHDRYTTAIEASRLAFPDGTDRVYVATGLAFPDALSGATAGAYRGAPILLIPGSTVPDAVIDEIMRLGARRIFIVGGTSVVTLTAEADLSMAGF
jgi:putative cell wall-binding protein